MQWNGLLLRPCSGSWKTFSRCRTRSTRTPPPTDLRLGTTPSLCIISSLLYCRQYTTVSIIRTYCDIRQLIINCNVESWVIFWAFFKSCPMSIWNIGYSIVTANQKWNEMLLLLFDFNCSWRLLFVSFTGIWKAQIDIYLLMASTFNPKGPLSSTESKMDNYKKEKYHQSWR